MKIEAVFKTSDDEVFATKAEAEAHQEVINNLSKVKADVKDLLNQILLKLEDDVSSDGFLEAIKDAASNLLADEDNYSDEDYYSSNC